VTQQQREEIGHIRPTNQAEKDSRIRPKEAGVKESQQQGTSAVSST